MCVQIGMDVSSVSVGVQVGMDVSGVLVYRLEWMYRVCLVRI